MSCPLSIMFSNNNMPIYNLHRGEHAASENIRLKIAMKIFPWLWGKKLPLDD